MKPGAWVVLVMAKAPIAGLVKTRLCPPLNAEEAAELAAAALLDTLQLARAAVDGDHSRLVLALDGDLRQGMRANELLDATRGWTVVPQCGATLGERLADAHAQVSQLRAGHAVVQIGMDTPHVPPSAIRDTASALADFDAVLGAAEDGGWWVIALRDPANARVLRQVTMSRATTAADTGAALGAIGCTVGSAQAARDIDQWSDALAAATSAPGISTASLVRRMAGAGR